MNSADSCLGHRFADPDLLQRALTHRSAGSQHYERLEFLGDAVLNFLIAEELYQRRPDAEEGELSRLRAWLVRGTTLAEMAEELQLGDQILLGSGERRSGGRRRRSILADVFEAVLGAILLDADVDAVRSVIRRIFASRLENLPHADELRDPKTRLQEWLQGRGATLPVYEVVATSGPAHKQHFTVTCSVHDAGIECQAEGGSRRAAEQAAARQVLCLLQTAKS